MLVLLYKVLRIRYRIHNFMSDIKWYIKNLVKYQGFLWRDRTWDYEYTVDIVIFKLKELQKCMEDDRHMSCGKSAWEIQQVLNYLTFIKGDDLWLVSDVESATERYEKRRSIEKVLKRKAITILNFQRWWD
jgi:hypothetical protein